ncbi:MAG: hypothetical protein JWL60_1947 [Gemmatimonadetes bacterium]|jgi:hypothetical protein|nr:hypothetical protein [Gemmatimonadota bacterium]
MSPGRAGLPSQSAALAGIPACVRATGPWAGRRQLFVKFAAEAETATIYTAKALRGEIERLAGRSHFHSVAIAGRDPLGESEFLTAALEGRRGLPTMLDHDGQRPEQLQELLGLLDMSQVTIDGTEGEGHLERVMDCVARSRGKGVAHALVIVPGEAASDARLLRVVEQAHAASAEVSVVLHPSIESASQRDRRWVVWLERAAGVHADVRLLPLLPAPTGSR